jgi:hypothetical protein
MLRDMDHDQRFKTLIREFFVDFEGVRRSVEQLFFGAPEAFESTDRHGGVPGRTRLTHIQLEAMVQRC